MSEGRILGDYDSMRAGASRLDSVAQALVDAAASLAGVAVHPDLAVTAVLSPATFTTAVADLSSAGAGSDGLMAAAAEVGGLAIALRAAVEAYQVVDAATEVMAAALRAAAYVAGTTAAAAEWTAATAGSVAGAAARRGQAAAEWTAATAGSVASGAAMLGQAVAAWAEDAPGTAALIDPWGGDWVNALPPPARTTWWQLQTASDLVFSSPGVIDAAANAVHDVQVLAAVALYGVPHVGEGMVTQLDQWVSETEGGGFPPSTSAESTANLIALGGLAGLFRDGTGRLNPQLPTAPRVPDGEELASLSGVGGYVKAMNLTGEVDSRLRVHRVEQPGDATDRWVVVIPGTQEWDPRPGSNLADLTENLHLIAGHDTAKNEAVRAAMTAAGVAAGDPVVLVGHSQGGISAASLASDPETRQQFTITTIVTAGSPIAQFDIPHGVGVIALEHDQDLVPRLDGAANPQRPGWVTPTSSVLHDVLVTPAGAPGSEVDTVIEAHDNRLYGDVAAAVDTSSDPATSAVRDSLDPFIPRADSTVTVQDLYIERVFP